MYRQDKAVSAAPANRKLLYPERGLVELIGRANSRLLSRLKMDKGLSNFRPADLQHKVLLLIADLPTGRVSIARNGQTIIGYVTFHRPYKYSRWAHHPLTLEVGGIEISPAWRKIGIASQLLKIAFSEPEVENYIIFTTEVCWYWDLKGNNLNLWQYRDLMVRLFASVGLVRMETDEPNITAHQANVFMARLGRNVTAEQRKAFQKLLRIKTD